MKWVLTKSVSLKLQVLVLNQFLKKVQNVLVRAALNYAIKEGRKSLTLSSQRKYHEVHRRCFQNWGYEVAEQEFGDKVFTWNQYDQIKEEQGTEAANKAQADALSSW